MKCASRCDTIEAEYAGVNGVKRNFLRTVLCALLMLTLMAAPILPESSAQAASTMKIMKVNVQGGRLREGPSSEYEVITTLSRGEKVFYSGKTSKAFCLVCTADGEVGYIYREFLSSYGTVRTSQVYYTVSKGVKMYKKPSTKASYTKLKSKQFVIVYKKAGNWAYVKTLDGKGGYIPLSSLEKA